MTPATRRIITGHAPDGRSVVAAEGQPPVVIESFGGNPGLFFTEVWRTSGGLMFCACRPGGRSAVLHSSATIALCPATLARDRFIAAR